MPCKWKRLAGRPTGDPRLVRALGSPPATGSRRCKVPSFCIGRALAPWIIRTRYGPQPEEKAACALNAPGGSTHGWPGCGPKSTHQQAL